MKLFLLWLIFFQSAAGWDHKEKIEKHGSQKDYSSGFGGKFGVQSDRQDKSAVGWDHVESVPKHESQKGMSDKYQILNMKSDKFLIAVISFRLCKGLWWQIWCSVR